MSKVTINDYPAFEMARGIQWEIAKGHLLAMLHTYHDQTEEYEWLETEIGEFIERVEERI